jgi:hypothetical protein
MGFVPNGQITHFHVQPIGQLKARPTFRPPRLGPHGLGILHDKGGQLAPIAGIIRLPLLQSEVQPA